MMDSNSLKTILNPKIHTIRGKQVILDRDLAELYGVSTGNLNKAVKRNLERFPEDFMFQLNKEEFSNWKFQNGISHSDNLGWRKHPFAFTEQGVSMLSGVLRSKRAIEINIKIIRAFVEMRHFISNNSQTLQKFQQIDQKLIEHDEKLDEIYKHFKQNKLTQNYGIFFEGQVFDAFKFVSDLINKAKTRIILIDNYVDETTLTLFTESKAKTTIYTKSISKKLELTKQKYNQQYSNLEIKEFNKSHDRYLIIDKQLYHFGASLKDLGKKWFSFSKLDLLDEVLERLD